MITCLNRKKILAKGQMKTAPATIAQRADVFHFLAYQQKVKRQINSAFFASRAKRAVTRYLIGSRQISNYDV